MDKLDIYQIINIYNYLDSKKKIKFKITTKYLNSLNLNECIDCKNYSKKKNYCHICNELYCIDCNYIQQSCNVCNIGLCDNCYLQSYNNNCICCQEYNCNKCYGNKCYYCKNIVCVKHTNFIKYCKYCNKQVCLNCLEQRFLCKICNCYFNTINCQEANERLCMNCK